MVKFSSSGLIAWRVRLTGWLPSKSVWAKVGPLSGEVLYRHRIMVINFFWLNAHVLWFCHAIADTSEIIYRNFKFPLTVFLDPVRISFRVLGQFNVHWGRLFL